MSKRLISCVLTLSVFIFVFNFGLAYANSETPITENQDLLSAEENFEPVEATEVPTSIPVFNNDDKDGTNIDGLKEYVEEHESANESNTSSVTENTDGCDSVCQVEIKVRNTSGEAIENALVKIEDKDAYTDENGTAYFKDVTFGTYKLYISADNYMSKAVDICVQSSSGESVVLNVSLFEKSDETLNSVSALSIDPVGSLSDYSDYVQKILSKFPSADDFEGYGVTESADCDVATPSLVADGKIYCFNDVRTYEYDVANDSWSFYPPIPTQREYFGVVKAGDKLYVMGGCIDRKAVSTVEVLDIKTGSWSTGISMPNSRYSFNPEIVNGKIYCAGGFYEMATNSYNYPSVVRRMDIYTVDSNTWQSMYCDEIDGGGYASAVYNGQIIYIGVEDRYTGQETKIYHPLTNTWSYLTDRPNALLSNEPSSGGTFLNLGDVYVYSGPTAVNTHVPKWDDDDEGEEEEYRDTCTYLYFPKTDEWVSIGFYDPLLDDSYRPRPLRGVAYNGLMYLLPDTYNGYSSLRTLYLGQYAEEYVKLQNQKAAAGNNHVLIAKNGYIEAKGDNLYGQLGNSTTTSSDTFITIPNIDNCIKVAAGGDSSYALTSDGKLYAWGDNSKGQAGGGSGSAQTSPALILDDIVDISAGINHAIAVKKDGTVWAWGSNTYGQLGIGSTGSYYSTPVKVFSGACSIAAGGYHSYVIDQNNNLYAAGKNDKGQLGLGNTANKNTFEYVINNVSKAAGGMNHSVILTFDGEFFTCGDNSMRQLGRSTAAASYSNTFAKAGAASDIWAGLNSTAYWQDNKLYQCGAGINLSSYFSQISEIYGLDSVTLNKKCYALTNNGEVMQWGLMSETNEIMSAQNMLVPQKIISDNSFTDVVTRRYQNLAIDKNLKVWAWGEGYYADGTDKMAVYYYPKQIGGISNAVQVSRGKNHNLVLDSSGNVWGWGSNTNYPMSNSVGGKARVATKITSISNVKQIAAGTEFSIFLKNDGTLWGVGKNDLHQISSSAEANYPKPVRISDKSDFVKVVAGDTKSLALDSQGNVYTIGGSSGFAELDFTFTDGSSTKITDISMGQDYCLALTDKGYVYSWGDNSQGQLGLGDKTGRKSPELVKISSNSILKNVKSISAGYRQSFAVTADNKVYGFGSGTAYQLAISNTGTVWFATLISALNNKSITKVAAGVDFSIALSNDGKIYSFGNSLNGTLGIYNTEAVEIYY